MPFHRPICANLQRSRGRGRTCGRCSDSTCPTVLENRVLAPLHKFIMIAECRELHADRE